MSWSFSAIGTAEKIAAAIEAESDKQTGQCKIEFDGAKPHLIGLVQQTFNEAGKDVPMIEISASGSGYARDGEQRQRSCNVTIKLIYGKLLI